LWWIWVGNSVTGIEKKQSSNRQKKKNVIFHT